MNNLTWSELGYKFKRVGMHKVIESRSTGWSLISYTPLTSLSWRVIMTSPSHFSHTNVTPILKPTQIRIERDRSHWNQCSK